MSMPYGPNLLNKFAVPYVCLYHVYVPAVHSCLTELYNIHGDTHATIKVTVQSEHEPYQSNGDTNYITHHPVPSIMLGTLNNPRNCHSGIKNAESPFLITMQNGIQIIYICSGLQFGWSGTCVNVIRMVWMSYTHCINPFTAGLWHHKLPER